MGRLASLCPWWGGKASLMQGDFKVIANDNTSTMPHDTIWIKAFIVQKKGKQFNIRSTTEVYMIMRSCVLQMNYCVIKTSLWMLSSKDVWCYKPMNSIHAA